MVLKKNTTEAPLLGSFSIAYKLNTSIAALKSTLKQHLSEWIITSTKDSVSMVLIESRDLNKIPYKFIIFRFYANKIEVLYTIPPDVVPAFRRWKAIRYFLNILTLIGEQYSIDNKLITQLLDGVISEFESIATGKYHDIYLTYSKNKAKMTELTRHIKRLEDERKRLIKENYALRSKYEKVYWRLHELTKLKGDELKTRIQEWITSHDNTIDIVEFAHTFNIPVRLVEEALNDLVKEGYLTSLD